jgi:hypothetical protein
LDLKLGQTLMQGFLESYMKRGHSGRPPRDQSGGVTFALFWDRRAGRWSVGFRREDLFPQAPAFSM